ncbi:MATE family efflux transporter [Alloiococcus sp. CFN-8]|uniref:MATE family efflux transporter n=1 Tax=Alloiococcus sp. CFN-8 TaxID=3416081 RepID=UPI003CE8DA26
MIKDRKYLFLEDKNIYRAFMYLAFPVMVANMFKSLHDMVDTYFIGQIPGSVAAQAGISITWPLYNLFMALSVGMSVAGVSLISQYLGLKAEKRAREYASLLLILSAVIGILFNLLLYFASPAVMTWMGAEGGVYDAAVIYLKVRAFEMPFLFIFAAFQAIRQAKGDTTTPVILTIASILINIILTAIFVRNFHMGVFGAALATLIGQVLIVPPALYLVFSKKDSLHISLETMKLRKKDVKALLNIATPSAGSQAFSSLGFLILQAVILSYGESVSAAFSIGNKISNLLLIPVMALGSVLAAFVGQNIGAGNKKRAKESYKTSRNVAFGITAIGSLLLFPLREPLIGLLTNDTETLHNAMEYMLWVLLTQPLMALFQNYLGVFNGSGNTRFSFYMAITRLWLLRLPMILIMKNFTSFGHSGIWYAMVLSNLIIVFLGQYLLSKVNFTPKVS